MAEIIDITGKQFTRWTVIKLSDVKSRLAMWDCICECGTIRIVLGNNLVRGLTKSCGCLRSDVSRSLHKTHGKRDTLEYEIWSAMIQRCTNEKSKDYVNYGARGIKVIESWSKFNNFINDMGPRPTVKHSLDRKDVDGNYEPSNCRWATPSEQARNRRMPKTNKSGTSGVSLLRGKWQANIAVDGRKMYLGYFHDKEDAVRARKQAEIDYWSS